MADEIDPGLHRPVRTFEYRLTRQDALAYGLLKHELTRGEKFKVVLLVGGAGMVAASLPQHWPSLWWWSAVVGILVSACVLAVFWTNLYARKGAAKLKTPDGPVTLDEWNDRLVERSVQGERTVPLDRISQVLATPQHLFLCVGAIPVIMPRAAFANTHDMAEFAERIDRASMPVVS